MRSYIAILAAVCLVGFAAGCQKNQLQQCQSENLKLQQLVKEAQETAKRKDDSAAEMIKILLDDSSKEHQELIALKEKYAEEQTRNHELGKKLDESRKTIAKLQGEITKLKSK